MYYKLSPLNPFRGTRLVRIELYQASQTNMARASPWTGARFYALATVRYEAVVAAVVHGQSINMPNNGATFVLPSESRDSEAQDERY